MSTNTLAKASDFLPETRSSAGSLFGRVRTLVRALAEAKAAADHYETLVAHGLPPGEASQVVFRTHFGQR